MELISNSFSLIIDDHEDIVNIFFMICNHLVKPFVSGYQLIKRDGLLRACFSIRQVSHNVEFGCGLLLLSLRSCDVINYLLEVTTDAD